MNTCYPKRSGRIVLSYMTGGLLAGAGVGVKTAKLVGALVANTGNAVLSAGEVYRGLKEQGFSDAEAGLYAASSVAINGALQTLLSGMPGLGAPKGAVSSAINGINNAILQAGARIGVNALSQGTTEALQSVISDLLKQAILGDQSGIDWEKAGYQAILGVITGGGTTLVQEAGKGVGVALDRAGSRNENLPKSQGKPENTNRPQHDEKLIGDIEGLGEYSRLADKARNVDVSTRENQAVFYSGKGNRARAEAFVKLNEKTTIEMTPGGKYFDSLKLFEDGSPIKKDQAYEIWKILTERYAKSASGNVYAFVKGSFPESIFNTVEYPALQKNPYITNIFTELLY